MKCYNHHDRDAFGIDNYTGKALCLECMEEYKGIIVEKNSEFSKSKADSEIKLSKANSSSFSIFYYTFLIFGILSIFGGILSYFNPSEKTDFGLIISGLLFLGFSVAYKKYMK